MMSQMARFHSLLRLRNHPFILVSMHVPLTNYFYTLTVDKIIMGFLLTGSLLIIGRPSFSVSVPAPWSPNIPCKRDRVASDPTNQSCATPAPSVPAYDGCPESLQPRRRQRYGDNGWNFSGRPPYTPHLGGHLQARLGARPRRGSCTSALSRPVRPPGRVAMGAPGAWSMLLGSSLRASWGEGRRRAIVCLREGGSFMQCFHLRSVCLTVF